MQNESYDLIHRFSPKIKITKKLRLFQFKTKIKLDKFIKI